MFCFLSGFLPSLFKRFYRDFSPKSIYTTIATSFSIAISTKQTHNSFQQRGKRAAKALGCNSLLISAQP
jgi:hypothetical protein